MTAELPSRTRIANDLKGAVESLKDADRAMSKVFTEHRHALQECDRLRNRVRELELENRKLRKWRDIGDKINQAIKEADEHAESVRAD